MKVGFAVKYLTLLATMFFVQAYELPTAEGSDQLRQQYERELASLGGIELSASDRTEEVIVSNGLMIATGASVSEINRRDIEGPGVTAGKWVAVLDRDGDSKWRYRWSTFDSTHDMRSR